MRRPGEQVGEDFGEMIRLLEGNGLQAAARAVREAVEFAAAVEARRVGGGEMVKHRAHDEAMSAAAARAAAEFFGNYRDPYSLDLARAAGNGRCAEPEYLPAWVASLALRERQRARAAGLADGLARGMLLRMVDAGLSPAEVGTKMGRAATEPELADRLSWAAEDGELAAALAWWCRMALLCQGPAANLDRVFAPGHSTLAPMAIAAREW